LTWVYAYKPKSFMEFPHNIGIRHLSRFSSGYDIYIHGCQPETIMPEELSQISFNPVTNNRATDFLTCRNT